MFFRKLLNFLLVTFLGFEPIVSLAYSRTDAIMQRAKKDYNMGNYIPALKESLSAYRIAVQLNDDTLIADAGNLLGLVYLAQDQATLAMPYFRRAFDINSRINNQKRVAANELNIAMVFSALKLQDSAVFYAKKALKRSQSCSAWDLSLMAANHLGNFYFKQNRLRDAQRCFRSVLSSQQHKSDWESSFASSGMARILLRTGDYRNSAQFADQAYKYAIKAGAKWDAAQALDLSRKAYWVLGDAKKAYIRLDAYKSYSDSLMSADKDRELNRLQLLEKSLENSSLQHKAMLLTQQARIDRLIVILAVLATLLLAVLLIGIYRRNRSVQNRNNELDLLNQHKDRLFSIIGHDLKSPFASLQGAMQLFASGDLSNEELGLVFRQLQGQVQGSVVLLDSLLIWASKQLKGFISQPQSFDLSLNVTKIVAVLSVTAQQKEISIHHGIVLLPNIFADPDQVGIIIQNVLSNAIKFTPKGGRIDLEYIVGESAVVLIIADNGVGMSADLLYAILNSEGPVQSSYGTANEKGIGLGMTLVKEFLLKNKIKLSAESSLGHGTKFKLVFPIPQN